MESGHFLSIDINWAVPMLYICFCALILQVLMTVAGKEYLQKWGFGMSAKDIEVDEDLPNFFRSVKLSQADELILENENMRENFGFEHNDPDTIAELNHATIPKKAMTGTPWYQILSNPHYKDAFQYIGAFVSEREKLIEDGY